MKYASFLLTSIISSFLISLGVVTYWPLEPIKLLNENTLGATITTINGSDTIKNSRTTINTNFSNLNTDKLERSDWFATSTAPQLTTLANLSTVGTITSGTWSGSTIGVTKGGTGLTTIAANGILLGNGTGNVSVVASGTEGYILKMVAGTPAWSLTSVDETSDYTWTGDHSFTNAVIASTTIGTSFVPYATASTSIASVGYVNGNDSTKFSSGIIHITATGNQTLSTTNFTAKLIKIDAHFKPSSGAGCTSFGSATSTTSNVSIFHTDANPAAVGSSGSAIVYCNTGSESFVGAISAITSGSATLNISTFGASGDAYVNWQAWGN